MVSVPDDGRRSGRREAGVLAGRPRGHKIPDPRPSPLNHPGGLYVEGKRVALGQKTPMIE